MSPSSLSLRSLSLDLRSPSFGLLTGESQLMAAVVEAKQLLVWNQEAVELPAPQGAIWWQGQRKHVS
jgi:hypothetical protein